MNDIEKALIAKCKNNDVNAFEKLISDYQKKVFNICYRYIGSYEDASELAQEVFIKVYKNISGFKEQSSLSTWIYKIAVTTCIDEIRRQKKHITVSIDDEEKKIEIPDYQGNPCEAVEKKEMKELVQAAIKDLNEDHREVIILRDMQGLSYEEISQILGVPIGTVKSRIKRARENIKEYLIKCGNFFPKATSY